MSNKGFVLVLLAVSLITHFIYFGHPNQTVFDEVHFGKFISGYYTHEYFFDIHPPLGKLIIAGFGKLFHFEPSTQGGSASGGSFATIGQRFPDNKYMALRFLPSLAGALLPVVLFLLALEVGFSRYGALALGFLGAIENALLVQSRFILLDGFLLLFGFTALWCYARYWRERRWQWIAAGGVLAALAVSVKWTGISFLMIIGVAELLFLVRTKDLRASARSALFLVVIPLFIYFLPFAVHFSLLTKSGPGDAFMSARFQKTLADSVFQSDSNIKAPSLAEKFLELNIQMYQSNQRLTATHPYSSKWYTWPLMVRPVFYWISGNERIYLLGNPILWWLSTVAIFVLFWKLVLRHERHWLLYVLVGAYIVNLLPFVGINRVMFLYHYSIALIFALAALVYLIEQMPNAKKKLAALALISFASFLYFAPLTYGLSLDNKAYEARVWLESWR